LFSKTSLKQLYRKLALALHPDREPDPVKQAEKTRIMGQLSQAWENKEMFTLLQLAHTHLPEFDNLLSDENLAYLNPMLKRQLRELEVSYYGGQDGLMGAVLHKFKQSSKKKTEQAFAEHRDYLLRDIDHLTAQLAEITTLQTLKPYLAARWDQKQMRWAARFDNIIVHWRQYIA
jgi:curved DNA-binding protein CbpA